MDNVVPLQRNVPEEHQEYAGYRMIRHDRIGRFEDQPRNFFDPQKIESLASSIEAEGQQVAVQVCANAAGSSGNEVPFTLIDGERRWRACTLIAARTGKPFLMKATIEVVNSVEEHFARSFGANFGSEEMSAMDIATGLQRLKRNGWTIERMSTSNGKSMTYVTQYLSLNGLHDEVKAMLDPNLPDNERLSVSHAIQIARVRNKSMQLELAQETKEMGLKVGDLKSSIEKGGMNYTYQGDEKDEQYYQPRARRIGDERRLLSRRLERSATELEKLVERIKHGGLDLSELYMSADDSEALMNEYLDRIERARMASEYISAAIEEAKNWRQQ